MSQDGRRADRRVARIKLESMSVRRCQARDRGRVRRWRVRVWMLLKRRDARHLRNQPRADEIQPHADDVTTPKFGALESRAFGARAQGDLHEQRTNVASLAKVGAATECCSWTRGCRARFLRRKPQSETALCRCDQSWCIAVNCA